MHQEAPVNRYAVGRALLSLFLVPLILSAGSYLPVDDRTLVEQADGIAVVLVLSSQSFRTPGGLILTDHLVGIDEMLKGESVPGAPLVIREVGGTVGNESLMSSTSPHFAPGEKALVFLDRLSPDAWSTFSGGLGKFSFVRDLEVTVLVREATDEEIFGWDLATHPPSERVRDAEEFLGFIRAVVGDDVVSEDGASVLEGPIEGESASVASDAADIWNSDSTSEIGISIGGTASSNTYGSGDGSNTVNFDVPESFTYSGTTPLAGSVVGQALLRAVDTQHTHLGESYYSLVECDIIIQAGIGSIETEVTAHEMGHCLGFRHSNEGTPTSSVALMYASVGSGASLKTWDRDAANQVYGDGTFDASSLLGNAFLMQFSFGGGARWDGGGFSMNVFETATACTAPSITTQPAGASIDEGQSHTMSVAANGTASFSYQWRLNGSLIGGATSASYSTPTSLTTGTYTYSVVVTNSCGNATSNNATVTVSASCPLPTINAHPQSTTITSGQSTTLSVSASGATSFQWYRGSSGNESQPIGGATSSSLGTGSLTSTTSYWVKVTNSCGSRNSNTATVTVEEPCVEPSITTEPQPASVQSGQSAILSVTASGTNLLYQWYRGTPPSVTQPVFGATSAALNTGALTATTSFWVRVFNSCGSQNSQAATVTVAAACTAPVITSHPASVTIQEGQPAGLSVAATGTSLQYQWYRGSQPDQSQPIAGATGPSLNTGALQSTTQFWVRVFNSCGQANSNTATVTVQPACQVPSIFTQPQSSTIARGGSTLLGVAVAGTTPFTFQWYRGASGNTSQPIAGATGASYNTGPLLTTTSFWVRVTNACDSVNSATATITVPSARRRIVRR